ncbi:hypothetical protein MASR2M8_03260 [Opitutaceae bacterium]
MDWRAFNDHGEERGAAFYGTALEYGQFLWMRGRVARAILCLDRAMGTDLNGDDAVQTSWPMPYAAMAWFMAHTPEGVFTGNPRVHFQHYADRMNQPRREQRQARAWACWALARRVRPDLPGDPKHQVVEPTEDMIASALQRHGLPEEAAEWQRVLQACRPRRVAWTG